MGHTTPSTTAPHPTAQPPGEPSHRATPYKDPVCGMEVDPVHPKGGTTTHAGQEFGFCSTHCRKRFEAAPDDCERERSL